MSAVLEVRDGAPDWWNSPDIWVVPGANPNGAPGQPVAGQPAFIWARVRNSGDVRVEQAQVRFWWANPAAGVLRSNATSIGASSVSLNPGEVKEVLCVVPWMPIIVNDGHECLVAEILHAADPLPNPLPDPFDPPVHRQVAQRNLTVLVARRVRSLAIEIAAPPRQAQAVKVTLERSEPLDPELLKQAGFANLRPAPDQQLRAGLTLEPGCPDPERDRLQDVLELKLAAGTAQAVHLHVWPLEAEPGSYVPLKIVSHGEDGPRGGLTLVVAAAPRE